MEEILIRVKPGGKVTITATGFKGNSCLEATRGLVEALGGDENVTSDTPTNEMYETQDEHQEQG